MRVVVVSIACLVGLAGCAGQAEPSPVGPEQAPETRESGPSDGPEGAIPGALYFRTHAAQNGGFAYTLEERPEATDSVGIGQRDICSYGVVWPCSRGMFVATQENLTIDQDDTGKATLHFSPAAPARVSFDVNIWSGEHLVGQGSVTDVAVGLFFPLATVQTVEIPIEMDQAIAAGAPLQVEILYQGSPALAWGEGPDWGSWITFDSWQNATQNADIAPTPSSPGTLPGTR